MNQETEVQQPVTLVQLVQEELESRARLLAELAQRQGHQPRIHKMSDTDD